MASDHAFNNYAEDPFSIEIEDYDQSVTIRPEPFPDNQYSFHPDLYRTLPVSPSPYSDSQSCPPSPTPSSSYNGSVCSPEQRYISDALEQLNVQNSPSISRRLDTLSTHSLHDYPSYNNSPTSPGEYYNDTVVHAAQNGLLHPNYTPYSPFYQTNYNPSSQSLPELVTDPPNDFAPLPFSLMRRGSSSSTSSSRPGIYTPDETPDPLVQFQNFPANFSFPNTSQGGSATSSPHSTTLDMQNVRDYIKDKSDEQAAPLLDVEQIRTMYADDHPGTEPFFKKSVKSSVSTPAGNLASDKRRKNAGRFLCKFCFKTFTRQLGLDNHLKSHLGIVDKQCRFCLRMFATSLGRHMKRCRHNPDRQPGPSKSTPPA